MTPFTPLLLAAAAAAAAPADRIKVDGPGFRAVRADGAVLTGNALARTILRLGGGAELRIDSAAPDPARPSLMLYQLSQRIAGGQWALACDGNAKGERGAFALRGSWSTDGDYSLDRPGFSVACLSGATGKCLRFGYRPWERGAQETAFKACTRMVRADYCGNGVSFTRNGMMVDIYDRLGVQKPEPARGMAFEAAWSPKGAVCVNRMRLGQSLDDLVKQCPLLKGRVGLGCTPAAPGALVYNSSFPQ